MNHVLRAALVLAIMMAGAGRASAQPGQTTPPQTPPATQTPSGQQPATPEQAPDAPAAPGQQPGAQTPGAPAPGTQAPGTPPADQPPSPGPAPAPATPGAQTTPAAATAAMPAPCPAPVPPATAPSRAFTATTGLLLHQVVPARVADFERLIDYVRDALAKTTNPTLGQQAKGWRFFKVAEAGPNGDVLYAWVIDPAVPCAEYAIGPILADVYRDPAQLGEIWKLYTDSVRNGGTIMNLVSLPVRPAPPLLTLPTTPPGATPAVPGQTPSTGTPPAPGTPAPPPGAPPSGTQSPGSQTPGTQPQGAPPAGPTPTAPGQAPQVPLDADPVRRP